LKRDERIAQLLQDEQWSEEQSVFGLPKVKVRTAGPKRASVKSEKLEPAGEAEQSEQ